MRIKDIAIMPVRGRPYDVENGTAQWLVQISTGTSLQSAVGCIANIVAANPCAIKLRVYGEAPRPHHVFRLSDAAAAIAHLDLCEAVGIFDSNDVIEDQRRIIQVLSDPSAPNDDEACIVRVIQPRPIIFIHANHDGIDVICSRQWAERLASELEK